MVTRAVVNASSWLSAGSPSHVPIASRPPSSSEVSNARSRQDVFSVADMVMPLSVPSGSSVPVRYPGRSNGFRRDAGDADKGMLRCVGKLPHECAFQSRGKRQAC